MLPPDVRLILRLKCTKLDFGWGSAPDPAGGDYSAPPDPIAGYKGPTSKGSEGMRRGGRRKGRDRGGGSGKRGKERGERGRDWAAPLPCPLTLSCPPNAEFLDPPIDNVAVAAVK